MNIAYNAALQVAKIALSAHGYRTSHEAHHYRLIHSLAFTIKPNEDLINEMNAFRKKRNISDYERAGLVSDQEVDEAIMLATTLKETVAKWLRRNHPDLVR